MDRHVVPLGHIIMFPRETSLLFLLYAACLAYLANTNFLVFGLTRSGIEPMTYRTRGEHANHYTTDSAIL